MDNMTMILVFFLLNQSWKEFVWDIKQLVKTEEFKMRKKQHEEQCLKKKQELAELLAKMNTNEVPAKSMNPEKVIDIEVSIESETSEVSESSEASQKTEDYMNPENPIKS